jgi:hypothetical protein
MHDQGKDYWLARTSLEFQARALEEQEAQRKAQERQRQRDARTASLRHGILYLLGLAICLVVFFGVLYGLVRFVKWAWGS